MKFITGNIVVELTTEEVETIEKAKEIILNLQKNMNEVGRSTAGWDDGYDGVGFFTFNDLGELYTNLDRFIYINEVY